MHEDIGHVYVNHQFTTATVPGETLAHDIISASRIKWGRCLFTRE